MNNLKTFEEYGGGYKFSETIPGMEDYIDMTKARFKTIALAWIPPDRITLTNPEMNIYNRKRDLIMRYGFEGNIDLTNNEISDLCKKPLEIENGTLVLKESNVFEGSGDACASGIQKKKKKNKKTSMKPDKWMKWEDVR